MTFQKGQKTMNKSEHLKVELQQADVVIVGAGAGLSTSAGFIYTGERFEKYFFDFIAKYHYEDMYSGGFYPYQSQNEFWAYFSRYIYVNRYMDPPSTVYDDLLKLVEDKEYFVLTTNVDHCFQKAGFAKDRLFYTQGDYGLFQCSIPCHDETYDNEKTITQMVLAQGFEIGENGELLIPDKEAIKMSVPEELFPLCPVCGEPMTMNLRGDDRFVQDAGWEKAADRYSDFLRSHRQDKVLFLELGVGYNTPGIIKYPFWQMTYQWDNAVYACINYGESYAPEEIREKSILINGDIGDILKQLLQVK